MATLKRSENGDRKHLEQVTIIAARASGSGYAAAMFLLAFLGSFLLYLEAYTVAAVQLAFSLAALIFLAAQDRLVFDGRRLRRTGRLPLFWARLWRIRQSLKIKDIEHVRTQTTRVFRRGGRIVYHYRTTMVGRGVAFTVASSSRGYGELVSAILSRVPTDKLDEASSEIRDFLSDPQEVLTEARNAGVPAADVLESTFRESGRNSVKIVPHEPKEQDVNRAESLRRLANRLKITGRLVQALEVFRRALLAAPADGRLLFDLAKCLHSFAAAYREPKLARRAGALMRLAERRSGDDVELLTRVAETYFRYGDVRRARVLFGRTVDRFGATARLLRGMAEVALREGKIAHAIHNFSAANALADDEPTRRSTKEEMDYFRRINDDEEYMELEISRVNLLDSLRGIRNSAFRIALAGILVIMLGLFLKEDLVANIGWAVSGIALTVWLAAGLLKRLFAARIPPEIMEDA